MVEILRGQQGHRRWYQSIGDW